MTDRSRDRPFLLNCNNSTNYKNPQKLVNKRTEINDYYYYYYYYLDQNISYHQLDKSDQKANTNTSPEIKISHNVE